MCNYLLTGTMYAGGSDFVGSGRQFKSVTYIIPAKDDDEAREKAKRFNITSPSLFKEIGMSGGEEEKLPNCL